MGWRCLRSQGAALGLWAEKVCSLLVVVGLARMGNLVGNGPLEMVSSVQGGVIDEFGHDAQCRGFIGVLKK